MLYQVAARVPGHGRDKTFVGCFDPTLVIVRLLDAFPEATMCHDDLGQRDVNHFRQQVLDRGMSEGLEGCIRIAESDAWRRGPIWQFRLRTGTQQVIRGSCERYNIRMNSEDPIPEPLKTRIIQFLEDLRFGPIELTSVRIEGNETTHVP